MTPSPRDRRIAACVVRAARWGVPMTTGEASAFLVLDDAGAMRKVDDVCRLVRSACTELVELSFGRALERLEASGGDVTLAIRRTVASDLEKRDGMPEALQHADDHGVRLTPEAIRRLWPIHGREGTLRHIAKVGAIRDAAAKAGELCPQSLAVRRLNAAEGDETVVIAAFVDAHRRRVRRIARRCSVPIPLGTLEQRADSFAACGCPICRCRLAEQLQSYIGKMIGTPDFVELDEDEARACGHVTLIQAVESWPGVGTGKFTGWFAAQFRHRLLDLRREQARHERDMIRLDAPAYDEDPASKWVSVGEQVPDRTASVDRIVIAREQLWADLTALREHVLERIDEYATSIAPTA